MNPKENELILIRHRNRLLAGACLESDRKTVRLETADQGTVRVPVGNVLVATGRVVEGTREVARWWSEVEEAAGAIELQEAWELVRGEEEDWPVAELADLCLKTPGDPTQEAALIVALDASIHFNVSEEGYRPASESDLASRMDAGRREAEREADRERFKLWWGGVEAELGRDEDPSEAEWTDRLKDVVLNGASSPHTKWLERGAGRTVPVPEVFDRLVRAGVWDRHVHLDLIRDEVPTCFTEVAVAEASAVDLRAILDAGTREDLTHVPVFTVDDPSSTDLDDALSASQQPDGSWQVGIHITDAASLVLLESATDKEAGDRLTSLYLPERRLPMLPPELSESAGSLLPEEDRIAVSVVATLEDGRLPTDPQIVLSVIRSRTRLSYDEADAILEESTHAQHPVLTALYEASEAHWLERIEAGAVTVERPEWQVSVEGNEVSVTLRERNARSQLMVSELMVYANAAIARACREQKIASLYRVQPRADLTDLAGLEPEPLRRFRMLRKLRPATVSVEPGFHGALGLDPYCQATSPLRRYLDLIVQRQLRALLTGEPFPYDLDRLKTIESTSRERLRALRRLEGRRRRYWLFTFLTGLVGETFEATVVDASGSQIRAETTRYGIPAAFRPEGRVEPGQVIQAKLVRCDPLNDSATFVHVV